MISWQQRRDRQRHLSQDRITGLSVSDRPFRNSCEERLMDLPLTLTMEQQFSMKVYEDQVKGMNADQAQEFLLEIMRQLMIKDNVIRHLLKKAL
jgi:Phycobilisome degradation protein nblA